MNKCWVYESSMDGNVSLSEVLDWKTGITMIAFSKAIAGSYMFTLVGDLVKIPKNKVDFTDTYAEVGILSPQMVCDVVDPFQSTNNVG